MGNERKNHHWEFLDYIQSSEYPMIILSEKGVIIAFNSAASAFYEIENQDLYNKNYFDLHGQLGIEPALTSADLRARITQNRTVTALTNYKNQLVEWTLNRLVNKKCPPKTYLLVGKKVYSHLGEPTEMTGEKSKNLHNRQVLNEQNDADSVRYQLESIIGCMPGNIYWLDKNGVTLGGNDNTARTFGLASRYEFIGITYDDMAALANWKEGQGASFRKDDLEVITTGKAKLSVEEPPMTDAEGKTIYFLTSRVPLRDQNNEITGVLGISIDITERKKMEKSLKEAKEKAEIANKAKTEFLENMRHDIRTPLSGIVGLSELLNTENLDKDKIKEFATNLDKASKELLRFLNEVLESINVASGEIPLLKKKFSLRETLNDLIALHQPFAIEKQLKLTLYFDENIPPYLIGDPIRIYRIILELLVNALKFTKKGHVSIFATLGEKAGKDVVIKISVEDTGVGISLEKQQELFVRFKRLTPSYEGIYKGAGLGLSIVKQFLEDLHGEIYVESNIDKGTKFVCVIPLKETLLKEDPFKNTTPSIEMKNSGENNEDKQLGNFKQYVLIVEDQPIAALAAKELLIEQGCEVDIVENGKQAIEQVQKHSYNLIIMDIGLPGIDGYEVTKNIRSLEAKAKHKTFIIGLTGHTDAEKKQLGLDAGMNIVLTKPLTQQILANFLKTFLTKTAH
jgi:PAS domain S-box-containing protein